MGDRNTSIPSVTESNTSREWVCNKTAGHSTAGYAVCYDGSTVGDQFGNAVYGKTVIQPTTATLKAFAGIWEDSSIAVSDWGWVLKGHVAVCNVLGHASLDATGKNLVPAHGANSLTYAAGTDGEKVVGTNMAARTTTSAANIRVFLYA